MKRQGNNDELPDLWKAVAKLPEPARSMQVSAYSLAHKVAHKKLPVVKIDRFKWQLKHKEN